MRSKKTIINTIFSLLEDFVAIICSFILPKLILSHFGSAYNGLSTSISQFLACAILLRSGIGGATKAALYKPLADNNKKEIDSIVKATDIFMKKIGLILAVSIICFAAIYPIFVQSDFSWLFTFSLFIIIGISTFAESFFGITYLIILQADQRLYISAIARILSYIVNILIATILILSGFGIHIVKLGSAFAFALYPIILNIYVKRKYKIDKNVKPNNIAISQRWDAFWHQVAGFINSNTDVMVLTAFTNMLEVSVYSVYYLVIQGLNRFITAFTQGIDAAFGNMIAKQENKALRENLSIVELIVYSVSTLLYSCAIILILQFVKIYTNGVTDVDYFRPTFAYILLAAQLFYAIRLPYQFVVQAAGHFKQTKKYSIIEAILNISVSIILVIKYGLIGVAIGTFISAIYKTIMLSNYMSKNIVKRSIWVTYKRCIVSACDFVLIFILYQLIDIPVRINWFNWCIHGLLVSIIALGVIMFSSFVLYKSDLFKLFNKIKNIREKCK